MVLKRVGMVLFSLGLLLAALAGAFEARCFACELGPATLVGVGLLGTGLVVGGAGVVAEFLPSAGE